MTDESQVDREYVAYHEAAHVVAYIAIKRSFKYVAIVKNPKEGEALGLVRHRSITPRVRALMSSKRLLDQAFVAMVGPSHDQYRYGGFRPGCMSDLAVADSFIVDVATTESKQAVGQEVLNRANRFVRDPHRRAQIKLVAQALLEHDTLTYKEVVALLK